MILKLSAPVLIAGLMTAVGQTSLTGAEWPRFRGPDGSGIAAADAKPATNWSETNNLKWKAALPGPGSSSPIVSREQVFVTCYSGYGDGSGGDGPEKLRRHLVCVARQSGKILWDKSVAAELPEDTYMGNLREHGYASSTPAKDGERVYVFFGKTGALAFDLAGEQLWKVNLGHQSSNRRWGSGASPILHQNLVIVNAADEGRAIFALDKLTGKEVWKAPGGALELSYVTPTLVVCAGGRTDLALTVPGELWGLNPETGKLRLVCADGHRRQCLSQRSRRGRHRLCHRRLPASGDHRHARRRQGGRHANQCPLVQPGRFVCAVARRTGRLSLPRERPGVCRLPGGEDGPSGCQG